MASSNNKKYNIYGSFEVRTYTDSEGRSTRSLGYYTGYIDDIAFALADKCCGSLNFISIEPEYIKSKPISSKTQVQIELPINSGIWELDTDDQAKYFKALFKDREVNVVDVHGYGSCTISRISEIEDKRATALAKLTDEEKHILGLDRPCINYLRYDRIYPSTSKKEE